MTHIKRYFWLYLLALSGLWAVTDPTDWAGLPHFFAWRAVLTQYSGVLGIGVMSAAMLLAVRPVWFEPYMGGLDKMYRLHKWLGIVGLVLSLSHWLLAVGPKWAIGWGWLERPVRGPRPVLPEGAVMQAFFAAQRGWAEHIGEWAFYAAAALMLLALVKRFPYRYFFKTHHLLAVAYLALVWHSMVLLKFADWSGPLGLVLGLLMAVGSVAAVLVLLGRVAAKRQVAGEVVAVRHQAELDVVQVEIALQGHWAGHAPGQFAFVTLHEGEGAHPYTISSAWAGDGRLSFLIKALGDYTRTLAQQVKLNDVVKVEGPYGCFNFQSNKTRQIWVGGGIGITPFIARMQALAHSPDSKPVDLFHTTAVYNPQAIDMLEQDAQAARVRSHVLWGARDGRLNAAGIAKQVPDWHQADIWFCGPASFGRALKAEFVAMGLSAGNFHQELFEMR